MVKSQKALTAIIFILLVLSLLGMVDSGYLTYEHFSQGSVVCIVGEGCNTVITSEYSEIFGIPLALLGLLYYLMAFGSSVYLSSKYKREAVLFFRGLVSMGLLFSLWFVYAQLFLINAICFYCMVSASVTLIMFILAWFLPLNENKVEETSEMV